MSSRRFDVRAPSGRYHRAMQFRLPVAVLVSSLAASCQGAATEMSVDDGQGPPVESGSLARWPEATAHLSVDVDAARVALEPKTPAGMSAFWSIASTKDGGSGYFYAVGASRVAWASSASRVQDIRDASALDFGADTVGPVPPGGIVVVQYLPSRRYFAIVIDTIERTDPLTAGGGPFAYANVRWYLTSDGSASFAAAR
jgi:hypothetical protein